MLDDPIVKEVRRIREDFTKQCDYDVSVIFANLRERQKTVGNRLVHREIEMKDEPCAAEDAQKAAHR